MEILLRPFPLEVNLNEGYFTITIFLTDEE